ncbi:MAG: hypothetical protein AAGE88_18170 [Actinomycetota bacterium]
MTDALVAAIERLAAAVERSAAISETELDLAGELAKVAAGEPCLRCDGRGYLGHPNLTCKTCNGRRVLTEEG